MLDTNAFDAAALRLLDEVARSGSFTAAAELLGHTQSAVSRRVAALERAAGGPLFERLPRGVRLTPAGAALHRHAVAVLDRLERAGEELAALHAGRGGTLRLGAFATANVDLVPGTLRRFAARRPGVELRLVEGLTTKLLARLRAGALDAAVVSDYPAGLPAADAGRLVPLREDRLLVALPTGHRLAAEAEVDLRDLAGETWIEAAPRGQPTLLLAACAAAGFAPRGGLRVAEWTGKFGFVAAGLGVTLVPELAARAVPAGLVLRPLRGQAPARRVYAALPEDPLPAALEFVRLLEEWELCTTHSPT
ncbi:LysR family transcriptional regulator [Nonomuraea wenchangensis]|uniref:DNA-binding transcriptional regulator, LysR family n=1 Tax=Nonomuraea wenchangensis TaxID=568860 RepID=A0A1I0J8Z2_9ACTN|nr:LysR family transcriptional regulator [Nonomuraea wenchangensis]SEU06409.1 DNA-binding transcriptional regulator, LysR family [Nonomuraea wenchangensis]